MTHQPGRDVPGVGEAGGNQPGVGEAGGNQPGVGEAGGNQPGVGEAGGNQPGVGEAGGNQRVADAAGRVVLGRAVLPARVLLLVCLAVVLLIVLEPGRPAAVAQDGLASWFDRLHAAGLWWWISYGLVEFTANVVMFLPLGVLGSLARPPGGGRTVVLLAAALSGTVELVQATMLPDRTGDLRDVASNTLGALVGVLAVALVRRRARRRQGELLVV